MMIGVLAFQGDVLEHLEQLRSLKMKPIEVRTLDDLTRVRALIIPGGESTVISRFLIETGVGKEIVRRNSSESDPLFCFGTCAGAIVLSKKVTGKNACKPLGLIDVTIDRNAYGSQLQSFDTIIKIHGIQQRQNVAFIRAPRITNVGSSVEILAEYQHSPVVVRQRRVLIATCHPEVRSSRELHKLFIRMATA